MPDFRKLRGERVAPRSANPRDIFNRLVKPSFMRDLLPGQLEVLESWWRDREFRDHIIKQNTGGGKTLVGILIAESTMAEKAGSVLYLCPNNHLVSQTVDKAAEVGISAERYERGQRLSPRFLAGEAMLVASYAALFNGHSRFGVAGATAFTPVSAIIFDDAHVELAALRDSFTLRVNGAAPETREIYDRLISILSPAFENTGKQGTFADVVEGKEYTVLEVPYWAWEKVTEQVSDVLRNLDHIAWPLIRDELAHCHCLIGRNVVSIVPILPPVDMLPTYANSSRRIFMSATVADDTVLAATFGLSEEVLKRPIVSTSLASVGERMILIPGFRNDLETESARPRIDLLASEVSARGLGVLILAPSKGALSNWVDVAPRRPDSPDQVEAAISELQSGVDRTPLALANRYDGIDLAKDACRLLVMDGLPQGQSEYETYRASVLLNSGETTAAMAQRIEQGLGRGSRGGGDWCAVLCLGDDLVEWVSRAENWKYMTASTRAQIGIGETTSEELESIDDLVGAVWQCLDRDHQWVEFHQEELFNRMEAEPPPVMSDSPMLLERKAYERARLGEYSTASTMLEAAAQSESPLPRDYKAWYLQMAARYASLGGDKPRASALQRNGFVLNRNLLRPPEGDDLYEPIRGPEADQTSQILSTVDEYTRPAAYVPNLIKELRPLTQPNVSHRQYEKALAALGEALGFAAERPDTGRRPRKGPDVLWLAPNLEAFVIEVKNEKGDLGHVTREDHGQLLQASEWFRVNYLNWRFDRVFVLPSAYVAESVDLGSTTCWNDAAVKSIVDDLTTILRKITALPKGPRRTIEALELLEGSRLTADGLRQRYVPLVLSADRAGERLKLALGDA